MLKFLSIVASQYIILTACIHIDYTINLWIKQHTYLSDDLISCAEEESE